MNGYIDSSARLVCVLALALLPLAAPAHETDGASHDDALGALQSGEAEEAQRIWSHLAEEGDAAAQSNLGGLYLSGALGEPDFEQALHWFRQAAEQEHAAALVSLGHMHRTGMSDVVAPDMPAALDYFRRAAEAGSAEGAYFAGELELMEGPQDPTAAVESIRRAAEAGFPPAMHRVGTFLQSGRFTREDVTSAITWYEAAAERGFAESAYRLGEIHLYGEAVPVDMAAALDEFEKAAAGGFVPARLDAGLIHLRDLAEDADPDRAWDLFLGAAEQWNYRAMYYLGLMSFEGEAVPQDLVAAHKWFNLAANGGHAESHVMRGAVGARLSEEERIRAEDEAQAWFDANHDTPHTHDTLVPHDH